MGRIIEVTFRMTLAEDDKSGADEIAAAIASGLLFDDMQDEIFAGSGCEVLIGAIDVAESRTVSA